MSKIDEIIFMARVQNASDIHITAGLPMLFRVHGKLTRATIQPSEKEVVDALYEILDQKQRKLFDEEGMDVDISLQSADGNRQRVNLFRQQGKIAATIRLLDSNIPGLEQLNIPEQIYDLTRKPKGLVLVTGPAGSGRSTTMASMLSYVNKTQKKHIITIENPIEYTYAYDQALIHQREVGRDVKDYPTALRSVLREDPDIVLVDQMSDIETMAAALTAAETGHLVLASMHTMNVVQTVERLVGAFPADRQNQVRYQLADVLRGIISRQLITKEDGQRVAVTEILLGTKEASQAMRDDRIWELNRIMEEGKEEGMHTFSMEFSRLIREGMISFSTAGQYVDYAKLNMDSEFVDNL